jgi:ribosomal protein S18 acetylase RimI-like enzyme
MIEELPVDRADAPEPVIQVGLPLTSDALNTLFAAAWPDHSERDWTPILSRSLLWVSAKQQERLVGFVNVAWDGDRHAFLLDTTVHPGVQRRGVGTRLVRAAAVATRAHGVEWLHVDYEPHLEAFYRGCGFAPTRAGLLRLAAPGQPGVS